MLKHETSQQVPEASRSIGERIKGFLGRLAGKSTIEPVSVAPAQANAADRPYSYNWGDGDYYSGRPVHVHPQDRRLPRQAHETNNPVTVIGARTQEMAPERRSGGPVVGEFGVISGGHPIRNTHAEYQYRGPMPDGRPQPVVHGFGGMIDGRGQ